MLPEFLRRTRPRPVNRAELFLAPLKASVFEFLRQAALPCELEGMRRAWRRWWYRDAPEKRCQCAQQERILLQRAPGCEPHQAPRLQHAPDLPQRLADICEIHDTETTGNPVKHLLWKGQGVGVGLLKGQVRETGV